MPSQLKNIITGVFIIGAIGLVLAFFFFLKPSSSNETQTLLVRFSNINKVGVGTRVLFAGKNIGEVTDVKLIPHARESQPADSLGRLYFYELTLKIDSSIPIYTSDGIFINTAGLLGEKSVSIVPKNPVSGKEALRITEKSIIYADSADPIETLVNKVSTICEKADHVIGSFDSWFVNNSQNISFAIDSFGKTMDQSVQILKKIQADGLLDNMASAMKSIKVTSEHLSSISQALSSGKGTLGKFIYNDDLYMRFTAIASKVDTLMNDFNNYGVLFHQNKHWQRTRLKRASLLSALNSPDDFKDYFQKETDIVNTSMSRLSMLIDRAQGAKDAKEILNKPEFKKNFLEMLRQVEELSSNLKLYNEQFSDAANNQN